jgi:hypothetical protein
MVHPIACSSWKSTLLVAVQRVAKGGLLIGRESTVQSQHPPLRATVQRFHPTVVLYARPMLPAYLAVLSECLPTHPHRRPPSMWHRRLHSMARHYATHHHHRRYRLMVDMHLLVWCALPRCRRQETGFSMQSQCLLIRLPAL